MTKIKLKADSTVSGPGQCSDLRLSALYGHKTKTWYGEILLFFF